MNRLLNTISREMRMPSVLLCVLSLGAYVLLSRPTYADRSARRLLSIVGPDLIVLDIIQTVDPILLVGGFLIAWWRVTAIKQNGNMSRAELFTTVGALSLILLGTVGLVTLFLIVAYAPEHGLPRGMPLPILTAVTFGYITTCVSVGAATGVVTSRSVLGRIGAFVVFIGSLFFQIFVNLFYTLLRNQRPNLFQQPADPLLFFFHRVGLFQLYNVLTNWIYDIGNSSSPARITVRQLQPAADRLVTNAFIAEHTFGTDVPWFLSAWVSAVVLALWLGVSLAVLSVYGSNEQTDQT